MAGGVAALLGCSDEEPSLDENVSGGPPIDLPYAPCPVEAGVGEFAVELGADYTSVRGKVFDGVSPALIPETLEAEGECRLLHLSPHLCDPACPVSTEICGSDNQCVALPVARSVGTVTVSGLLVPVEMSANPVTGSYRPQQPALPHPGFEPGADLRLSAGGGDYAGFGLRGWGVSPLVLTTSPVEVLTGTATRLAWNAPNQAGPARLQVQLHINNHGSSNAWIECDVADTGAAEVPARLIDALSALGRSGFPTITLTRRTATSTSMALGCVQMLVTSEVTAGVAVAGLTSCNTSDMCPEGQTCRPLERFCE